MFVSAEEISMVNVWKNSALTAIAVLLCAGVLMAQDAAPAARQGGGQRAGGEGQRGGGGRGGANLFPPFSNLQILPRDIGQQQLLQIMLGYESALGVTCEHCHVDFGRGNPMNDFASEAKAPKKTARVMMTMLRDINQKLSADLGKAPADLTSVQCGTCHRGKAIPEYVAPPPPVQPGGPQGGGRGGPQ
jgi:hypothetical protein